MAVHKFPVQCNVRYLTQMQPNSRFPPSTQPRDEANPDGDMNSVGSLTLTQHERLYHDCGFCLLAIRLWMVMLKPQDATFMGNVWLLDTLTQNQSPSYDPTRNPTTVCRIENRDQHISEIYNLCTSSTSACACIPCRNNLTLHLDFHILFREIDYSHYKLVPGLFSGEMPTENSHLFLYPVCRGCKSER